MSLRAAVSQLPPLSPGGRPAGLGRFSPCIPDVTGRTVGWSLVWLGRKVCKNRSEREAESGRGRGRRSQQHPAALRFTWHGLQKRRLSSG